jgi:hypothetical protein
MYIWAARAEAHWTSKHTLVSNADVVSQSGTPKDRAAPWQEHSWLVLAGTRFMHADADGPAER